MKHFLTILYLLLVPVLAINAIPSLHISTPGKTAIDSKDIWTESCTLNITDNDGNISFKSANVSIKARGHSSFSKPKKPFSIRLDEKASLLGMKENKRWVLLAGFMDHSLIRNETALLISRLTSMQWTPDSRFVDVILNGEYQGCYLLCEKIRVGKNSLNISKTDGFLFEIDTYPDHNPGFSTPLRNLPVKIKYPEKLSERDRIYIQNYFTEIEEILYSKPDSGSLQMLYKDYIDMDSFVDWWIIHELTQNAEPNGPRSCYMYKDADGLLKAGPVWDFDLAFISVGVDKGGDLRPHRLNRTDVRALTIDSIYNKDALWYDRLLKDSVFQNRISQRWIMLRPEFAKVIDRIDSLNQDIRTSAIKNQELWIDKDPARFDTCRTFDSSVENIRETLSLRLRKLDTIITVP